MAGELTQAPKPEGTLKKVPIDPSYPPGGGTIISIQKTDVFAGGGEKAVSEKQTKILMAPVDPKEVKILPDTGSLYLPWNWFAHRLTKAFGPMGWSLLPVTDGNNTPVPPVAKDNVMYREFVLRAEGRFIGTAVGECAYNPNNKRMTFGDAVEGAKSNALSRCCKALGMAHEIYLDEFRANWVNEFAICVVAEGWNKTQDLWRRKDALPLKGEKYHQKTLCPCATCKAGGPTTAADGRQVIDAPVEAAPAEWSGGVKDVRIAPKANKSDPERFLVFTDKEKFNTFDREVAKRAKEAKEAGLSVTIHHKPSKHGPEITALIPAQPPEEEGGQQE